MKLDEMTIGEAREIAQLFSTTVTAKATTNHPYEIGANYFIRTVTHHHTGRLVSVTEHELVLADAAWIADDGRLTQALANCEFNEVEMFPAGRLVIVGRGSVIDAVQVTSIPKVQK